jgi:electron transport complex protein RnfC
VPLKELLHRKTFRRGVHPEEHKEITRDKEIRRLPFAPRMIIPLSQHLGRPAVSIVHVNQEVVRGEPVARADGFMSIPMHAPATGVIEGIELMPTAKGPRTESILLKPYPGDDQQVRYGTPQDLGSFSRQELINAIQATGMAGLGGAGFPAHVKMAVPKNHVVDTVIVNGCECEPYLTNDHRIMIEETDELIAGIEIVIRAVRAERAIIGIEDNKPDAIEALRTKLAGNDVITVEAVETKYPQGSEKLLIKTLLDREVPSGGFPYEIGVVVQNVATLAQLGALLPAGQGLIERVVTISGPGVKKPGNYLIAIGTPLAFVLEQIGFTGDISEVIFGGPMMGTSIASLDAPVTKAVSGILVFDKDAITHETSKIYPCIHCGRCVEACPLHLNPSKLGLLAAKREYETMEQQFHLNDCFECGSCSYVCPSNIPLVQYFRIAKAVNRERVA